MAKTVLLVDNDQEYVRELSQHLEQDGLGVIAATTAAEARQLCQFWRPDIAISEIMLEYPDAGFTLCHTLKKKDPTIPIMLVSNVSIRTGMTFNVSTPEERAWIKADVFLDKPVPFETIRKEIQRLI
jgi:CheY-like chemotaxis protein